MKDLLKKTRKISIGSKKEGLMLLTLALPFVAMFFVFSYIPLFGWIYAFFNYKPGISLFNTNFVGLEYFRILFADRDIVRVLINTFALSFLSILCSPFPLVLAIMLNEVRNSFFKKLVQTITTLPYFISWVIVYSLAFSLFSTDGLINQIFKVLGISDKPINVLGNVKIVWIFQTCIGLWRTLGWNAIIYIAAIAGIDKSLYDAAYVDGASRIKSIIHITIPGIAPTFIVLLLLAVSNMLSAGLGMEQYLVFKNSMIVEKIEVLDLYVYKIGLVTHDYSYATAVGIFKSVVSIIILFAVNGLSKIIRGNSII